MNKALKIVVGNSTITLDDKNYKAAGGQGAVFVKNDTAFKIYHDPQSMIPVAKIQELGALNRDDVLAPVDIIYDLNKTPIGFTMKYIDGVEFLCKLFTKTFRDDKGITPQDVSNLVVKMQQALEYIHAHGILVVDYNEMNFLLGNAIVYHIDVDSWQTRHFKAPAIMESIRDRSVPRGTFNELTDWFSFAVVTFQMYTGIHPYKGMHPDFKPKEWDKRMEQGVSVFDKKVKLPDTCQDFSVIPGRHLGWYKELFMNGGRSIPPYPDGIIVSTAVVRTILSKGDFIVRLLGDHGTPIKSVYHFGNKTYVATYEGIFIGNKKVMEFQKSIEKTPFEMCNVPNEDPVICCQLKGKAEFFDLKNNPVGSVMSEKMMGYNGMVYVVNNGELIQNSFERLGRVIHRTDVVCDISRSYKVFRGVVAQDDFMKCRLAIPYDWKKCANIHVPELDGRRIIDAQYAGGKCILVTESKGNYLRVFLCFNKEHLSYTFREDPMIDLLPVNFVVLPNGLCVAATENTLMFQDNRKCKEIEHSPFNADTRLYNENMQVMFADGKKLYAVNLR